MSRSTNQAVQDELARLERLHILTTNERAALATRYPTAAWDVLVLVRWLTVLGAVAVGVGVLLLAEELVTLLRFGELALVFALLGCAWLGRWVARVPGLPKTGAVLELLSGFALLGLTTLLALDFSTGSKNWPLLVGVQATLLSALAYGLANRLVLILALVCFFVFFGGETGYAANGGAYWLGMNYPLRFLAAGGACCIVAWYHARELRGAYQAFSRVYAHFGLLITHLSLWFFALFGYFDGEPRWADTQAERLVFSAVWAGVSLGCVWLAGHSGLRLLRGYGLTFLVLDLYTFYFQFIAFHSAELWWLHLLLVGASLMFVGSRLERRLREPRSVGGSPDGI